MRDFIFTSEELENDQVRYRTDAVVKDGVCNVLEFYGLTDRAPLITEGEGSDVSDFEKKLILTFHKGTQYPVTDFIAMAKEFGAALVMQEPNGANAEVLFDPNTIEVVSISFNLDNPLELEEGESSAELIVTATFSDESTEIIPDGDLVVESGLTLTDGIISGVAAGTFTITATLGEVTEILTVNIVEGE